MVRRPEEKGVAREVGEWQRMMNYPPASPKKERKGTRVVELEG